MKNSIVREKILAVREKNFSCERKILVECCIKNYNRPLCKRENSQYSNKTCDSSFFIRHKQCDVIGDLCIPKPSRI